MMSNAEKRARAMIAAQSTRRLIEQFELTELVRDEHIPTVRGWLMDELKRRDPVAYDAWIDCERLDAGPREFFI